MISLLFPARGRFEKTKDVIESAYDMSRFPDEVETIIRIDEDDTELVGQLDKMPRLPGLKFIIGDRMKGYASLYSMVNELCGHANGDLMLLWSNDVWFKDKGWDEMYRDNWSKDDINIIHTARDEHNVFGTQFPMITRRVYELLGHYALHTSIDDYITWVGIRAGCGTYSKVLVFHDRIYDDVVAEEKETAIAEISMKSDFMSSEVQGKVRADSIKLMRAKYSDAALCSDDELSYIGDKNICLFYGWPRLPWSWE